MPKYVTIDLKYIKHQERQRYIQGASGKEEIERNREREGERERKTKETSERERNKRERKKMIHNLKEVDRDSMQSRNYGNSPT